MLMDIKRLEWSEHMLKEFGVKRESLAEIRKSSSDNYGEITSVHAMQGVPITG